jgi:hypothetical protein
MSCLFSSLRLKIRCARLHVLLRCLLPPGCHLCRLHQVHHLLRPRLLLAGALALTTRAKTRSTGHRSLVLWLLLPLHRRRLHRLLHGTHRTTPGRALFGSLSIWCSSCLLGHLESWPLPRHRLSRTAWTASMIRCKRIYNF